MISYGEKPGIQVIGITARLTSQVNCKLHSFPPSVAVQTGQQIAPARQESAAQQRLAQIRRENALNFSLCSEYRRQEL